jgi:hypothetical protein
VTRLWAAVTVLSAPFVTPFVSWLWSWEQELRSCYSKHFWKGMRVRHFSRIGPHTFLHRGHVIAVVGPSAAHVSSIILEGVRPFAGRDEFLAAAEGSEWCRGWYLAKPAAPLLVIAALRGDAIWR